MFDLMINGVLDSKLKPLKQLGIKLTNVKYQKEDVIIATNLPTNYKAELNSLINELVGFGLKVSDVFYKNTPAMILSNIPAQYKQAILNYISNNF